MMTFLIFAMTPFVLIYVIYKVIRFFIGRDSFFAACHDRFRSRSGKVNAVPGHSITLGALGCFILWFGWYGFNGAAAWDGNSLASIFVTTTVAPAVATCTTMIFTWIKNGKPDVSMCLNGSLAGLVAVTAGCDAVDALGSAVIGVVSGVLIVAAVEVLDLKCHIDDPVGAVGVHFANGVWGTLAVGLLAALVQGIGPAPRVLALWILAPVAGLFSSCQAVRRGLNNYLAWLAPAACLYAANYLLWRYSPPAGPGLLTAFASLVGAAAGEVLRQRGKGNGRHTRS